MSETDSTSAEARLLPPPAPPAPPVPHRLYRDPKGPIGGVASGFAMYFDLDPVIVRLLWIVSLLTGLGGPGYLVCWVVVPKAKTWPPPGHQSGSLPGARSGTATLTSGLVIVGLAALIGNGLDGAGDLLLPAALVGFGVYLLSQRAAAREGAAPPLSAASPGDAGSVAEGSFAAGSVAAAPATPRGLVTPTVLSLLALGAGVCWALGAAGVVELSLASVAAGGLVLVGGGLIASLWFGRAPRLILVGLGLAVLLLVAPRLQPWFPHAGKSGTPSEQVLEPSRGNAHGPANAAGEHVYQPSSLAELAPDYALGMGELTLDLSRLDFTGTTREVRVQLGMGEASVIVPPGTHVEVSARVGVGEVDAFEQRDGGFGKRLDASSEGSGAGTLHLDFNVGIGEGTVRRGL